jgi:hypothetical protein
MRSSATLALLLGVFLLTAGCASRLLTDSAGPVDLGEAGGSPFQATPAEPPTDTQARYAARLEAALAISNPFERDDALASLATDAAAVGQVRVVKRCLAALSNPFCKDATASCCALRLGQAKQGSAAVAVARTISNPFERDAVLRKMAAGG